jgi:hypothetical protein
MERGKQPTHHMKSSVFDEAYKGDVSKLFDKAYKVNMAHKGTADMADMMYYTATLRFDYSLTDIDADELVDEEEEATDEEPPEEHDDQDQAKLFKDMTKVPAPTQKTMREGEIAPLDALYPMMRVLSNHEKQKTRHRMSAMHECTHKEDVKKIAPLDALHPTMRVSSDDEKKQTLNRLSAMHKSTYQEDVKNETYRENRSCAKTVEGEIAPLDALYPTMRVSSDDEKQQTHHRMSAMHELTYK